MKAVNRDLKRSNVRSEHAMVMHITQGNVLKRSWHTFHGLPSSTMGSRSTEVAGSRNYKKADVIRRGMRVVNVQCRCVRYKECDRPRY